MTNTSEPLTEQELQEWRGSPLTVKVLKHLKARREICNQLQVYPDSVEKTALNTALKAGMVKAYDDILNLKAEGKDEE